MKEGRPILEMERPFFREFLVSLIVSFLIVGALFGILAIISISLVTALQIVEPSELVVEYSKEREKLEKGMLGPGRGRTSDAEIACTRP